MKFKLIIIKEIIMNCLNNFREWEMGCAFQTAVKLHKPELIFVLGK